MELFGASIDLTRIVFLLGAVLALVYKKKIGVTPGGIIAPGVLAAVLYTSVISFAIMAGMSMVVWAIYKLTIARYPLSRRWASLATISLSVIMSLAVMFVAEQFGALGQDLMVASLVIPGLFTIAAQKYGLRRVASGMMIVTLGVYLLGLLLLALLPTGMLTQMTTKLAAYDYLQLSNMYLVLPISLIVSALIYWRFGLRGGGYMVGPIIATIAANSPVQALMLVAGILASYMVVRLALRYTHIIGLERFVLSIFLGFVMVSVMDLIATMTTISGYQVSATAAIVAVAVIVNDMTLQSLKASTTKAIAPAMLVSYITRLAV